MASTSQLDLTDLLEYPLETPLVQIVLKPEFRLDYVLYPGIPLIGARVRERGSIDIYPADTSLPEQLRTLSGKIIKVSDAAYSHEQVKISLVTPDLFLVEDLKGNMIQAYSRFSEDPLSKRALLRLVESPL